MSLYDLLTTASSNLLRSKLRTFLTIIAIFIGAMTITLTNGIGTGVKSYLNKQMGNLGATNVLTIQLNDTTPSGPTSASSPPAVYNPNQKVAATGGGREAQKQILMNAKDISTIKAVPGITSAVPARAIVADYIMGTGGKYQVSLQQQFGTTTAQMLAGGGVNAGSSQNQITIPANYVSSLGYASNQAIIGKTVTIGITSAKGTQSTVTATITGVQQIAVIGPSAAYMNTALANQLYAIQSNGLPPATTSSYSTVAATFPSSYTPAQITNLENALKAKGYTGQTIKDKENTVFNALSAVIIILDIFGVIALLAASFGIVNTLLMSVQERTKEIGLMKALGMGRGRIFTLFSIEAVLIGFWGSLLGVAFAALVGSVVNAVGKHTFLKNLPGLSLVTFPLSTIVVVMGAIMIIAFLAGTLPAYRASKKDPIEALRYE